MDSVSEAAEIVFEGYDNPDHGDVRLRIKFDTFYGGMNRVFVIFVNAETYAEAIAFETASDRDDGSFPIMMSPEVAMKLSHGSWLVLVGFFY